MVGYYLRLRWNGWERKTFAHKRPYSRANATFFLLSFHLLHRHISVCHAFAVPFSLHSLSTIVQKCKSKKEKKIVCTMAMCYILQTTNQWICCHLNQLVKSVRSILNRPFIEQIQHSCQWYGAQSWNQTKRMNLCTKMENRWHSAWMWKGKRDCVCMWIEQWEVGELDDVVLCGFKLSLKSVSDWSKHVNNELHFTTFAQTHTHMHNLHIKWITQIHPE